MLPDSIGIKKALLMVHVAGVTVLPAVMLQLAPRWADVVITTQLAQDSIICSSLLGSSCVVAALWSAHRLDAVLRSQ